MESNCPSCKTKLEHEDYLFEVVCTKCGMRFNPFYETFQGGEEAAAPPPAENFQESTNAFQEIVQFGENLGGAEGTSPTPDGGTPAEAALPSFDPEPQAAVTPSDSAGRSAPAASFSAESSVLITSGDTLSGHRIQAYLPPQSVWANISTDAENPLESAFMVLWENCTRKGANGVVAVQWRFTPDGGRVLISGTPVRCEKE